MAKTDSSTEKQDLTMGAYHAIQELILRNELMPGQQLNSRHLGEKFGMSPTPVTQALKLLHFQGFLNHVPNKGYTLQKNSIGQVEEIFSLRLAIEPFCMDTILERIDDSGWKRLYRAVDDHKDALAANLPNRVLLADIAFHTDIAGIAIGETGAAQVRHLFEMLYLKDRPSVLYSSPRTQFATQHEKILSALEQSDTAGAKKHLIRHIKAVQDALISNMKKCREDAVSYIK